MRSRALPCLSCLLLVAASLASARLLSAELAAAPPPVEVYPLSSARWALVRSQPSTAVTTVTKGANGAWEVAGSALRDDAWTHQWQQALQSQDVGLPLWTRALDRMASGAPDPARFQRRNPDIWLALRRRSGQPPTLTAIDEAGVENLPRANRRGSGRKTLASLCELLKLPATDEAQLDAWIGQALQDNQPKLELASDQDGRSLRIFVEPFAESEFAHRLLETAMAPAGSATATPPGPIVNPDTPPQARVSISHALAELKAVSGQLRSQSERLQTLAFACLVVLLAAIILSALPYLLPLWRRLYERRLHEPQQAALEDNSFATLLDHIHTAAVTAEEQRQSDDQRMHLAALEYSRAACRRATQDSTSNPASSKLFDRVRPDLERWSLAPYEIAHDERLGELIDAGRAATSFWKRQLPGRASFATAADCLKDAGQELLQLRQSSAVSEKTIEQLKSDKTQLDSEIDSAKRSYDLQSVKLNDAKAKEKEATDRISLLVAECDDLNRLNAEQAETIEGLRDSHDADVQVISKLSRGDQERLREASERADKLGRIRRAAELLRKAQIDLWNKPQHPPSTAVFLYIRFLALYQLYAGLEADDKVSEDAGWINLRNLLYRIDKWNVTTVQVADLEPLRPGILGLKPPEPPLTDDPEETLTSMVLSHMTSSGGAREGFDPAKLRTTWPILFRVERGRVGSAV